MSRFTVTPARIDGEPLAGGALPEGAGLVVRVDLFEVGHADDAQ